MNTHDTPPTDDSLKPSGDNLTGDLVEIGIRKYSEEFHDDLRWWFRFAHVAKAMSQAEAATQLGIDTSTYSRVFRGEYKNGQGLMLPPPAKMLSRIRIMAAQERDAQTRNNIGRVMTPTVQLIHDVCNKAWRDRQIAMIFGESHVGKTYGLTWFRDENNHGATIFVDLQGAAGVQDVYRAFARALKLSDTAPINKLMPRIFASIDKTNLVICDEFHHITYAYQKRGAILMLNAIKAIKDRCGCAMVICGTNVARDEFETGTEKKLLKQLWRRGVIKLQLPDALPVGDVRAFATAYGLPFPPAPANEDDDLWKSLHENHPTFTAAQLCDDIAYNYGVLHLASVLTDGKKIAAKRNRPLKWDDVIEAQRTFTRLALKKAV